MQSFNKRYADFFNTSPAAAQVAPLEISLPCLWKIPLPGVSIKTHCMEPNNILHADVLDILFEGRNKEYGAYILRQTYNQRMYAALTTTVMVCLLFVVATNYAGLPTPLSGPMMVSDEITLQQFPDENRPEHAKPPAPKPEQQKVAMAKVTIPVIVPDNQVNPEEQPPVNESLENIAIGTENIPGEMGDVVQAPAEAGTGTVEINMPEEKDAAATHIVQVEAQFPGGLAAWSTFLERNLNAEIPVENAAPAGRYTVIVSFLVDKDGNISEVEALNNPGYGTAEEAVRVIKKSKKWTPAIQNGRSVVYRQQQSITFEVSEG